LYPSTGIFTPDEVAYIFQDSGASAIFTDHEYAHLAAEAASRPTR
jgi:long-subunit acyl-CoA synthetase (AMP-forming)